MKKLVCSVETLVLSLLAVLPPRQAQASGCLEKLNANQICITTIPEGKTVYFAPQKALPQRPGKRDGEIEIVNGSYKLKTKQFYKGRSPTIINNVSDGDYWVGIAPLQALGEHCRPNFVDNTTKVEMILAKTTQDTSTGNLSCDDKDSTVVYSITKGPEGNRRYIFLALDKEATIDELTAIYPKGNNYSFEDAEFVQALRKTELYGQMITSEDREGTVVGLLHRGGKVDLGKGHLKYVIEIVDKNKWNIHESLTKAGRL